MKFDIQKFAEGEGTPAENGGENQTPAPADNVDEGNKNDGNKADDVQAIVDAALARAQAKWDAELKKREELIKKETQRLSNLSEAERQQAELENTRKELETQRAEFEREKIKYEATKVLAQRNLPVEFVEYLVDADNESTLTRITTFEKKYKKAIEDGVNEKLKGRAPASGGKAPEVASNASFMKAIYDSQINV